MAERELPTHWHAIWRNGIIMYVDIGTRRQVESWLEEKGGPVTLTVDSIADEECTLIRDRVGLIFSSTPESRAFDREHQKLMRAEIPVADRE